MSSPSSSLPRVFALFLAALLGAVAMLASPAAADVTGIQVLPYKSPLKVGDKFTVHFQQKNSITNNQQYTAAFGLSSSKSLGTSVGSRPFAVVNITSQSSVCTPPKPGSGASGCAGFDVALTLPQQYYTAPQQTLGVAVFGSVGASGGITTQFFNASVTVVQNYP